MPGVDGLADPRGQDLLFALREGRAHGSADNPMSEPIARGAGTPFAFCVCMQVLVRHDDTIRGSDRLTEMSIATLEDVLARFVDSITTVEVHFADENGKKSGGDDIRCSIEVRFEGRKPVGVTHHAADLEVALEAAAEKMARMLDHHLGRIREPIPADI